MSSYLQITNATNSWVRFTMPYAGVLTWQFDFRSTDKSGGVLASNVVGGTAFRAAWISPSTSGNIRIANLTVDGLPVPGSVTNRGHFADFLCDGNWRTVKYTNHARATTDNGATWPLNDVIEFVNYNVDVNFCPNADVCNFKIDIGNTGSWTHESLLGDSDGFSRNNVTVVQTQARRRRYAGGYGL